MICPVELANEVSAFGGAGLVLFVEAHALLKHRSGAGDEGRRSDHAGNEQGDHLVSGRGDHWQLAQQRWRGPFMD